jgi:DNA end-binding protein Ku
MARALWKGAITFGLVHVPVELYPAQDRKEFEFSMLDKRDLSPVGYKRFNKRNGNEVEWNDIVKGYEYDKDQYVVLSDEDLRRANVEASQTIEIQAFVPAGQIPPQYYETPYYLAPVERGKKVYALLRESLRATELIAIAQVVIRTTQHLAAVVPAGAALMLNTMRYANELREPKGLNLPAVRIKAAGLSTKELDLAKRLIDDMTEDWDASKFKDTYHEDLMHRIEEKIEKGQTKEITEPDASAEAPRKSAQIIDLAALLRKSLERQGGPGRKPGARRVSNTKHSATVNRGLPSSTPAPSKATVRRKRA